jgi:hypothetical protein
LEACDESCYQLRLVLWTKNCLQCNYMHRWCAGNFNSDKDNLEDPKCQWSQVHVRDWIDDHDGTACCYQDRELSMPHL